jgi:hypothetical protein
MVHCGGAWANPVRHKVFRIRQAALTLADMLRGYVGPKRLVTPVHYEYRCGAYGSGYPLVGGCFIIRDCE